MFVICIYGPGFRIYLPPIPSGTYKGVIMFLFFFLHVQLISYKRYLKVYTHSMDLSLGGTGSCGYLFHEIPGICFWTRKAWNGWYCHTIISGCEEIILGRNFKISRFFCVSRLSRHLQKKNLKMSAYSCVPEY